MNTHKRVGATLLSLIVSASLAGSLLAQEPAVEPVAAAIKPSVALLIDQLGSPSFIGRETASQHLLRLGEDSIAALKLASDHPDPEIRLRSERILQRVLEQVHEQRLADFAADTENSRDFDLPGWQAYRKLVGDDSQARSLFVEMQRNEPELLRTAENHPQRLSAAFIARSQQLQIAMSQLRQQAKLGSVATLVFVASTEQMDRNAQTDSLIYSFCSQTAFTAAMQDQDRSPLLRKLLGLWMVKATGSHQSLLLAMRYDVKDGITIAKKMVSGGPVHYRQYAIFAMAKLGSEEDLPLLEKLLEDRTVCYSTRTRDRKQVKGLICDVALLGLLHLTKQDPTKYGLANVRHNDYTLFQPNSQYFASEEQRKAALEKWQAFRKESAGK